MQSCTTSCHAAEGIKDRLADLVVDVVTLGLGLADIGLDASGGGAVVTPLEVGGQGLAVRERALEEQGTNDIENRAGRLPEMAGSIGGVGEHAVLLVERLVVVKNLLLLRGKAKGHLLLRWLAWSRCPLWTKWNVSHHRTVVQKKK